MLFLQPQKEIHLLHRVLMKCDNVCKIIFFISEDYTNMRGNSRLLNFEYNLILLLSFHCFLFFSTQSNVEQRVILSFLLENYNARNPSWCLEIIQFSFFNCIPQSSEPRFSLKFTGRSWTRYLSSTPLLKTEQSHYYYFL